MNKKIKTSVAGFTFIEVIISLLIISISLLSIILLLSWSLTTTRASYYRTAVILALNNAAERINTNNLSCANWKQEKGENLFPKALKQCHLKNKKYELSLCFPKGLNVASPVPTECFNLLVLKP